MKQKRISKEKYIKLFCPDKRIRERMVIYVSSQIHRKMRRTAFLFREQHVSTSSLADAILSHHFSTHKDLLNQIMEEDNKKIMSWLHNPKECNDSSEDEENYDDGENEIENSSD